MQTASKAIGIHLQASFTEGEEEESKQKRQDVLVRHCGLNGRLVSFSFQISNIQEHPEMLETVLDNPCGPVAFPSLVTFGTGMPANFLWVKLPPRDLHHLPETPALLSMGKHSFSS